VNVSTRLLSLTVCLLALLADAPLFADSGGDAKPLDRAALDQQIYKTLRDVINKGADLYNNGDQNGCYRLYEGAVLALQPLLDQRPEIQKAITTGVDNARRNPDLSRRAFVLRDVIDQIRNDINPRKPEEGGKKPGEGAKPLVGGAGKTVWERLGGEANVKQIVDDFVEFASTNPRVDFDRGGKYLLTPEKGKNLRQLLVEWISANTGGPYKKYTGKDMKTVHAGMAITDEQFNALAADLKRALSKNGAKVDDVKAVLAAVESTRADIVEKAKESPKPPEKPADDADRTASVSGKVTVDGKPLDAGKVIFHPEEGKSVSVMLKEDGSFELKALKPGKYILTVDAGPAVALKYSDPTKSGLQVVVLKGTNNHDIELSK
jgi:hemoglobin